MKQLAVIFDMDGVIVDNHEYHFKSWKYFCEKYQLELSEEEYMLYMNGRTVTDVVKYLFKQEMSPEQVNQYSEEKEALYREIYLPHLKATRGLDSFLKQLESHNTPRAIATSAPTKNVELTLTHSGVGKYFSTILDATRVSRGKPDPEVYLKTAEALGMDPACCVVFEDAISGIQAAKNAGMKVIATATTQTREELKAADLEIDLIIDHFEDLTIEDLYTLFAEVGS